MLRILKICFAWLVKGDLIYCPNNYFYYSDCKFIALGVLKSFKLKRSESKDKEDVKLISLINNRKGFSYRFSKFKSFFTYKIRNFKYYFPLKMIVFFKKIHL